MDYQESREYIDRVTREIPSVLGLDHMREMMKRLGHPQDDLKYVHVAGTNGKGSVIAFLYSVLSEAGYRVGRYVSPTLYSYRGRMEISGKRISRDSFAAYMTQVADVIAAMTEDGYPHPTAFEIETAVAFLFFRNENCDLVLLEVGMGGNLDATNIIRNTVLAVLVPISMDHQAFLGNTLSEIAEKKAGIIKPGCSVVTVGQQPETMAVIERVCRENGADLTEADLHEAKAVKEDFAGQTLEYRGENYELALAGSYQTENAALALEALEVLGRVGYPTTVEQRKKGLKDTKWNGRLTIIHREPLFIVDGAHNPAAADMLEDSVRKYFKGRKLFFIMGVFRDKDYPYIIRKLCPYAEQIITIETPGNPRALPAQELAEEVKKCNPHVQAADSILDAVDKIFAMAGREDVILSFGSLSFIGEITTIVKTQEEKNS